MVLSVVAQGILVVFRPKLPICLICAWRPQTWSGYKHEIDQKFCGGTNSKQDLAMSRLGCLRKQAFHTFSSNTSIFGFTIAYDGKVELVWEPNTFFEDLLHPLVRKLFLHLKEAMRKSMRKSMLDVPVPGSF